MAEKFATTYRFVENSEKGPVRHIFKAGDKVPGSLDKKVRDDLRKRKLVVNENRLSPDGLRLPYGHPDSEVVTEPEPEQPQGDPQGEQDKGKGKGKG